MRIHAISTQQFAATRDRRTLDLGDGAGRQRIEGPSEAGKTRSTVGALTLALWGCDEQGGPADTALIYEGQGPAEVALHLHAPHLAPPASLHPAASLRARLSGSSCSWEVMGKRITSKAALAKALGPVGERRDLGLAIVSPFWWRALALAKNGRDLRDLLLSLLPTGDLGAAVAEAMGDLWREGLPLAEKAAMQLQKEANTAADRARGAAQQAQRTADDSLARLAAGLPTPITEEEVRAAIPAHLLENLRDKGVTDKAREYQARWQRFEEHLGALARYQREVEAHQALTARKAEWEARVAEIRARLATAEAGGRPEAEISRDMAKVRATMADIAAKAREIPPDLREKQRRETELRVIAASPSLCPHCGKPTDRRFDSVEAIATELETVRSQIVADQNSWDARYRVRQAEAEAEMIRLQSAMDAAKSVTAIRRELDAAGPMPQVGEPPVEPAAWSGASPTADRAERAARTIAAWEAAEQVRARLVAERQGALRAYEQAESRAESDRHALAAALEALRVAVVDADRARALVDALRRAPTRLAQDGQAALLKRMQQGGMSIVWRAEDGTGPEVEVLVDGRPWHAASFGRQIWADAWFRSTLRAMAIARIPVPAEAPIAWRDLPIVVDNGNVCTRDWWPSADLPLWVLYTVRTPEGRVVVSPWPQKK